MGILKQNEKPCTVWAPKLDWSKQNLQSMYFCYSLSFEVFNVSGKTVYYFQISVFDTALVYYL